MPHKILMIVAALLGLLGVGAGAFGAHALKGRLSPEMLNLFDLASRYQLIHALAAAVAATAVASYGNTFMLSAGWLFVIGTVFFSGSLYLLALTDLKAWGALTPIGGVFFLGGWLCMAIAAWRG